MSYRKIPYKDISDIVIYGLCYTSYPCFHGVEIVTKNGKKYNANYVGAITIITILKMLKKPIPDHFTLYTTGNKKFVYSEVDYLEVKI